MTCCGTSPTGTGCTGRSCDRGHVIDDECGTYGLSDGAGTSGVFLPDARAWSPEVVVECGYTQAKKIVYAVKHGMRLLWIPYPKDGEANVQTVRAYMFTPADDVCWFDAGQNKRCSMGGTLRIGTNSTAYEHRFVLCDQHAAMIDARIDPELINDFEDLTRGTIRRAAWDDSRYVIRVVSAKSDAVQFDELPCHHKRHDEKFGPTLPGNPEWRGRRPTWNEFQQHAAHKTFRQHGPDIDRIGAVNSSGLWAHRDTAFGLYNIPRVLAVRARRHPSISVSCEDRNGPCSVPSGGEWSALDPVSMAHAAWPPDIDLYTSMQDAAEIAVYDATSVAAPPIDIGAADVQDALDRAMKLRTSTVAENLSARSDIDGIIGDLLALKSKLCKRGTRLRMRLRRPPPRSRPRLTCGASAYRCHRTERRPLAAS